MLTLTDSTRAQLERAQDVLLSPLRYDDAEGWLRAAAGAVQEILGGDHSYAFSLGPSTTSLIPTAVDPDFEAAMATYLVEALSDDSAPSERPLPLRMHAQRVKRGSGVYHEQHLVAREEVEQSPFFQEVAAPFGVRYATGMSATQGATETALCVAFETRDAPGFAVEASEALSLLVPAFETGLRHLERFQTLRTQFRRVLDELTDALFVFSVDGREQYRNDALRHLLEGLRDPALLSRAALDVALSVAEGRLTADSGPVRRVVQAPTGAYTLRGTWAGALLDARPGVIVSVEPHAPYPSPLRIRTTYDLTPRQAEVALLVAKGHTDAQIAEELCISMHTVRRHLSAVRAKLEADTRTEVAHRLAQHGRREV